MVAESAALVVAAAADPGLLGAQSMEALAASGPSKLGGAVGTAWATFQRDPLSRHVALFVQEVVGRACYQRTPRDKRPQYTESVNGPADVLWFPGALALMQAAARSFHYWRVSSHVTGVEDAAFERGVALPESAWPPGGSLSQPLSKVEADIAGAGFATLRMEDPEGPPFISFAPTCHTGDCGFADLSEEDRVRNRQVAGALWITRWMQALKVVQREQVGTWKEQSVLELELNLFLESYCRVRPAAPGSALLSTRAQLRSGSIRLDDKQGPYGYGADLSLQPDWRLDGRFPTYRIRNRLDKE